MKVLKAKQFHKMIQLQFKISWSHRISWVTIIRKTTAYVPTQGLLKGSHKLSDHKEGISPSLVCGKCT